MDSSTTRKDREMPYAPLIGFSTSIIFMIVWMLDNIFSISLILNRFCPLTIRSIFFVTLLCLGVIFLYISRKILFHNGELSDTLVTDGIFGRVRHPMYLGGLLIFISFILLSISLISIALFIIIFILYNKMATYEEKILEGMFRDQYLEYKKQVPKWIPKLKKNRKKTILE